MHFLFHSIFGDHGCEILFRNYEKPSMVLKLNFKTEKPVSNSEI